MDHKIDSLDNLIECAIFQEIGHSDEADLFFMAEDLLKPWYLVGVTDRQANSVAFLEDSEDDAGSDEA